MRIAKPKIEFAWTQKVVGMDTKISDYLVPAMAKESSCPFHKMGAYLSGKKNPFDDVAHWHQKLFAGETEDVPDTSSPMFRTCWGAQELFKDSLVLRSPTDLVISYNANREIICRASTSPKSYPFEGADQVQGFFVHQHPIWQTDMDDGTNILDGKIAIKLIPPFKLKVHSKSLFFTPSYHSDTPWGVLPGLLPSGVIQPNVFLELDLPPEGDAFHLQIKRHDPIAYMYFMEPHNLHNMKEVPVLDEIMRTKFMRGMFK